MKKTIAIVEDERDIAELVSFHLEREGFNTIIFQDGDSFLAYIERNICDFLVLDLMLPSVNGLEILKTLRAMEATAHLPVLILTARSSETDRVLGLELGADDYLVKPFSPRELVARVKAILRRQGKEDPSLIQLGDLEIHRKSKSVKVMGEEITLTHTEYRLLETLALARGEVFSRKDLLKKVWGEEAVTERTVDVHIKHLREKLGPAGQRIKTLRGWGYKLI
ncbi:MAG: DNA-binding response regulator [Aquificota bacterium]|uniref:Phosphate regulon transcriptional regulatory protein PhoB n=1 Tax=Thermosulfidibacter takaii TaxID=412593 RepID=A0A7C0Y8N6_9BACT|nr:MAG: DNA-binding response regulator [Aquificota bacterium]HDD53545.1 response regulator transcription factor [Thermosulfidibacter takaii]